MPLDVEIGYVAGFLDGEGTITLMKRDGRYHAANYTDRSYYEPRVAFCNTNKDSLLKIKDIIKTGRVICEHTRHEKYNHLLMYSLTLGDFHGIIDTLTLCLPHLVIKQKQAQVMLDFCNLRLEKHARANLIPKLYKFKGKRMPILVYGDEERRMFEQIRLLNSRQYKTRFACVLSQGIKQSIFVSIEREKRLEQLKGKRVLACLE